MDSDDELDIVEQAERAAGSDEDVVEVQREASEDEVAEADTIRQLIKPKRVVRNPKPKLNADTLKGARGLTALAPLFAKQKFKGKGYEEADLNKLLKTYEYWCHRLYPKMRFDQCIEKIETLGSKKPVMTYVKRMRMGLLDEEPPQPRENLVDEDEPTPGEQESVVSVEARFDSFAQRDAPLTDEQMELVRANRERAMQLRLRRTREQAESKLGAAQSQNDTLTTFERPESQRPTAVAATRETYNVFGDDYEDVDFDRPTPIEANANQNQEECLSNAEEVERDEEQIDVDEMLNDLNEGTR